MDCDPPGHFQMPTPMIKLKSSDGEIFQVEVKVAKLSLHLKEMLDDLGVEENEVISIPRNAPKISGAILGKIIQWANHHKDDPASAEDDEKKVKPTDDISSWDVQFLQVDQNILFQLILAADYLNIKGLLDVTCKTVAKTIKGMSPEDVRQKLHIQNDFSADEEEQVRKENKWCEGFASQENNDTSENGSVQVLPASHQDVDMEVDQVMEDCLNNSVVVRNIFQHLPDADLLKLSIVNKMWNFEARRVMKKRGDLFAFVRCTDDDESCQENVEAFIEATQQMNIVPFSGIKIRIHHRRLSHASPNEASGTAHGVILDDQLQLKKVSVELFRKHSNCPGLLFAKKVFHDFSEVLEELSLHIHSKEQKYIEDVIQECGFPNLKVLKLREFNPNPDAAYTGNMKVLVSRAPRLQQVYTEKPTQSVLNALEGSSAVVVLTERAHAPFGEIQEATISRLRLQEIQLFYTGPQFNLERFSRIAPALLQASCTTTLRSVRMDAVLTVPLMCYGICLENVKELVIHMNHHKLETLEPRILRTVKNFDFTHVFPNLDNVWIEGDYSTDLSPNHMDRIMEIANIALTDPTSDRAAKVKEVHLRDCNLSDVTARFFTEMFPNIEKLEVASLKEEEETPFECIWKHWVDLKELQVTGKMLRNTGNLDSVFCGIFPEEVAELRQKDEEYLKSVHIVPVMPAITGLKNLRVLKIWTMGYNRDECVDDGTFMFSKVTQFIAFGRYPALAVRLNFMLCGFIEEARHLGSFASVMFW